MMAEGKNREEGRKGGIKGWKGELAADEHVSPPRPAQRGEADARSAAGEGP